MSEFYSNGKLMISGEYLALHGALSLAVPTKFGQTLSVKKIDSGDSCIHWRSWIKDDLWLEADFSVPDFRVVKTNSIRLANRLSEIFTAVADLNATFLDSYKTFSVDSRLDFDISWGLGSSSSLLSNIAYWGRVDPFELHFKVSQGSGYDIACARARQAVIYSMHGGKPEYEEVRFCPPFRKQLFFVYSGEKKESAASVSAYQDKKKKNTGSMVDEIGSISDKMLQCTSLDAFMELVVRHEVIISKVIGKKRIKESRFSDFDGEVKSLGAWGGDFLLFCYEGSKEELKKYLQKKSLEVVFGFDEILKS